jgi:predicted RNA-binding protein
MCLSKAFIEKNGKTELLMSEIAVVRVEGGKLILKTLFGEQREVQATIREIDFMTSRMELENPGEVSTR